MKGIPPLNLDKIKQDNEFDVTPPGANRKMKDDKTETKLLRTSPSEEKPD